MWTVLSLFFTPIEFLQMQALNRYAYTVSISRVQTKWREQDLPRPLMALTIARKKKFRHILFVIKKGPGDSAHSERVQSD